MHDSVFLHLSFKVISHRNINLFNIKTLKTLSCLFFKLMNQRKLIIILLMIKLINQNKFIFVHLLKI